MRSGERSALDPDFVPVHHRVHALIERFPEGPPPEAEIKAIRSAVEETLPEYFSLGFEPRERAREQAKADTIAAIHAAAPFAPEDLYALSAQLPDIACAVRLKISDLDLPPDQVSTISSHLLRSSTTYTVVLIGASLANAPTEEADIDALRCVALLGGSLRWHAMKALERAPSPTSHLHWVFTRCRSRSGMWAGAIARQPVEAVDTLLKAIPTEQTAALGRALAALERPPQWFGGHRRFAEALVSQARELARGGNDPASLTAAVQLWDELRYGNCAFLGFAPGEREGSMSELLTLLRSDNALTSAQRAGEAQPGQTDIVWLQRRLREARGDDAFPPGLGLRAVVPAPSTGMEVRLCVLVDGLPLVPQLFDSNGELPPGTVLYRGNGLRAGTEPHERWIAEAMCTERCCGALTARIASDEVTSRVTWELRNTRGDEAPVETLEFDAAAYAAEVVQAEDDLSWEWPARRAARFLRARLEAEPEVLACWDCRFYRADSWNRERTRLEVVFSHPADTELHHRRQWLQFAYSTHVPDAVVTDDAAAHAVADAIVERLREGDSKAVSKVCGGSRESAEAIGYPWP